MNIGIENLLQYIEITWIPVCYYNRKAHLPQNSKVPTNQSTTTDRDFITKIVLIIAV